MFCSNCGKNLPDDARFCDGCGAQTGAAATAATAAPAAPAANPIFDNAIAVLKSLFTGKPTEAVSAASKSSGIEWVILWGIAAFINMLYAAISPVQYNCDFYALGLVEGLLEAGILFFAAAAGLFLIVKLQYKKALSFNRVLNLVAAAAIPLACARLLNIGFGFIWSGLANTVSSVALILFALLVFIGLEKLVEAKGCVLSLAAVLAAVMLIGAGFGALWNEISTPSATLSYGSYNYDDRGDYSDYDLEDFADELEDYYSDLF